MNPNHTPHYLSGGPNLNLLVRDLPINTIVQYETLPTNTVVELETFPTTHSLSK